jgi:hypothetical protein
MAPIYTTTTPPGSLPGVSPSNFTETDINNVIIDAINTGFVPPPRYPGVMDTMYAVVTPAGTQDQGSSCTGNNCMGYNDNKSYMSNGNTYPYVLMPTI